MLYIDRFASDGKRKRKDDFFENLAKDFEGKTKVAEAQYKYEEAKQNYKNLKSLNDKITELNNQVEQLTDKNKTLSTKLDEAKNGLSYQAGHDRLEYLESDLEELYRVSGMYQNPNEFHENMKFVEYQSFIENIWKYLMSSNLTNPPEIMIDFCLKHYLIIDPKESGKPFQLTLKGVWIMSQYIRQESYKKVQKLNSIT